MPASDSPNSGHSDDFFNVAPNENAKSESTNDSVPRPKRIACILCRKRKLKCDGNKPSCSTCSRLGHNCEYSEERKKSGPKRGYVKLLEARLKQVENLLETRDAPDPDRISIAPDQVPPPVDNAMQIDPAFNDPNVNNIPDFTFNHSDDFSWEMIGLGLEEALPNQDVIDEMNQVYFQKVHPSMPMIHMARHLASMDLAPHMRPAICLRYAMWTHACALTTKYAAYTEHFYQRARKYAEQDEMRGHGESMITLAHCQAWTLIACYEFRVMYFPRAWMSIGRASRLALMMGLHRQDRVGLDVKQTLPPPRDWTDREERRRTFWMAFCQDRYASIGTGWPMTFDEADILTNLPASDEAFHKSRPESTPQLTDVLNGEGTDAISSFSGVILLSTLYGRNLTHLHRPNENDADHDLNGEFWKRHRQLDNILLNISLAMPASMRLPASIGDPNAIFVNMNIHTATICLHQAAIFKADKNQLPAQISAESKRRCIVAADQVTNIMKMISHIDLSLMNPFLAFCLYVAARVFVQYLKSRKEDSAIKSSLHFLLAAMQVLKIKNPLTESFLVQLDVDLEGTGLDIANHSRYKFGQRPPGEVPANTDAVSCSPLFEIRSTQGVAGTGQMNSEAPRWSGDKNTPSSNSEKFAGAFTRQQPLPMHETIRSGENDLCKPPAFNSDDPLYGNQLHQISSLGPSPNYGQSEHNSSSSHSNQPTPSSSNRHGSYSNFTPPQPNQGTFSPAASGSSVNEVPLFGSHLHGNMAMPTSVGDTEPWNFVAVHQNKESPMNSRNDDQQSQNQPEMNFNTAFGGRTGMTPGNTGMTPGPTGMTPGATGMTPLPESIWQSVNDGGGNEWIYGWGGTPQQ